MPDVVLDIASFAGVISLDILTPLIPRQPFTRHVVRRTVVSDSNQVLHDGSLRIEYRILDRQRAFLHQLLHSRNRHGQSDEGGHIAAFVVDNRFRHVLQEGEYSLPRAQEEMLLAVCIHRIPPSGNSSSCRRSVVVATGHLIVRIEYDICSTVLEIDGLDPEPAGDECTVSIKAVHDTFEAVVLDE